VKTIDLPSFFCSPSLMFCKIHGMQVIPYPSKKQLPRGLGFAASSCSHASPEKHLCTSVKAHHRLAILDAELLGGKPGGHISSFSSSSSSSSNCRNSSSSTMDDKENLRNCLQDQAPHVLTKACSQLSCLHVTRTLESSKAPQTHFPSREQEQLHQLHQYFHSVSFEVGNVCAYTQPSLSKRRRKLGAG